MYAPVTDVSTIRVPVQIIVGADDKLTPPAISRKMAAEIAGAKLAHSSRRAESRLFRC